MNTDTGVSAPYGHACARCARAKCKCVTSVGGGCERCRRLGQECAPAALMRKRRPKKPNPAARRSQLEDKLSDLVTLLQAQHSQPLANEPSRVNSVPDSASTLLPNSLSIAREVCLRDWNTQNIMPVTMASKSAAQVSPVSNNAAMHDNTISQIKAERDLYIFRTYHLNCFPVFYISAEVTNEQIQSQRPFLWSCIKAVCAQSPSEQTDRGMHIWRTLATRVAVEGERTIDLLLGLLIFISWSFYFARGKPLFGMALSMAKSLVIDLRLDRPAGDKPADESAILLCPKPLIFLEPPESAKFRTNEGRRALLCCFVLIVSLASITGHEPMRWGSQMEESIAKLSENHQCHGDEILVAIAQISKVSEDAATLVRHGPEDPERAAPAFVHVKSLGESLARVRNSLSADLLDNHSVLSYLHSAEILIYETALFQPPSLPLFQAYEFRRLEYLHTCLHLTTSFLDEFLILGLAEWIGLNFPVMVQLTHSIQVLHRLSCLQHPGWDLHLIRSAADVLNYLEKAAVRMEQASVQRQQAHNSCELSAIIEEPTVFLKGAQVLRSAIPVWAASLEKADARPEDERNEPVRDGLDDTLMDFSDETWFTDMFSLWNV